MLDVMAVTLMLGPDGGVCTGGPENGIPDMIITIPLDIRMAYALTIVFFGPEIGSMMGISGVGLHGPHIGMIFFRGTRAVAPSQLGM